MSDHSALQSLESDAYKRAYSDGIVDLFVGVSLLWIGAAWIWLTDFAGLAGVLPAAFVPVAMAVRKQVVETRVGYVKWSEPRRNKERRNLIGLLAAGVLLFFVGIAAFLLVDRSLVPEDVLDLVAPGLLAWLLSFLALALAYAMEAWRFVVYAITLAAAGLVTALQEANPGWPMLTAGLVVTITGVAMLVAFLRDNPVPEE
jgi:hypothetical protein